MVDELVVMAKVAAIDNALKRIEEVRSAGASFLRPIDAQDLTLFHLQRAAQSAIDLAAHVVATQGYGLPTKLADGFTLLEHNGILDTEHALQLRRMVGFRNLVVHQYESVAANLVEDVVTNHLDDLRKFAGIILKKFAQE